MHNLVLSPIDPEILITSISERVTANILNAVIPKQPTETERWFNLNELCQYHPDKPTKPTVYGWVNAGTIPVHKGGKKLRFLKSEIDSWLKQREKKASASATGQYLSSKKRWISLDNKYKGRHHGHTQLEILFTYLREHIATASMVSAATGVPQKNICRYKRYLERKGCIWELEKKPCKMTGFKAWYLTTNPDKAPKFSLIQLNLFEAWS